MSHISRSAFDLDQYKLQRNWNLIKCASKNKHQQEWNFVSYFANTCCHLLQRGRVILYGSLYFVALFFKAELVMNSSFHFIIGND